MHNPAITALVQPGLLPVFRFFAWLQLGIALMYGLLLTLISGVLVMPVLLPLLSAAGFLAVLSDHRLRDWLRQAYLPLLLAYATLHVIMLFGLHWQLTVTVPVLELAGAEAASMFPPQVPVPIDAADVRISLALLIVLSNLFFLLLLVSWQYDMRGVIVFCLAATALDLLVNVILVIDQSLLVFPNAGIILFRNVIFVQIATVIHRLLHVQQEQRAALVAANAQLTRYAITVEELAISRERDRLSRELHDTLAHTLSAAAVQMEAAQARWPNDPDTAQIAVDKALVITREGLIETRRALKALRASPLETLGLKQALHDLIVLMQARSRAAIILELPAELPVLRPDAEQTIYRAVQETLENAIRHAQAGRITVTLTISAERLLLRVEDDGHGFDPARTDISRFGLRGLRERAHAVGGRLEVTSAPGRGTAVLMEVPL